MSDKNLQWFHAIDLPISQADQKKKQIKKQNKKTPSNNLEFSFMIDTAHFI